LASSAAVSCTLRSAASCKATPVGGSRERVQTTAYKLGLHGGEVELPLVELRPQRLRRLRLVLRRACTRAQTRSIANEAAPPVAWCGSAETPPSQPRLGRAGLHRFKSEKCTWRSHAACDAVYLSETRCSPFAQRRACAELQHDRLLIVLQPVQSASSYLRSGPAPVALLPPTAARRVVRWNTHCQGSYLKVKLRASEFVVQLFQLGIQRCTASPIHQCCSNTTRDDAQLISVSRAKSRLSTSFCLFCAQQLRSLDACP
jgi:hypothetical protein